LIGTGYTLRSGAKRVERVAGSGMTLKQSAAARAVHFPGYHKLSVTS
jgi:hypothetical protein